MLLSEANTNINIENILICKEHKKKFKGFSKFFLNNYCEDCYDYIYEIYDNDIIRFDDIKIEENKIEELIKKLNYNNNRSKTIKEVKSNDISSSKVNESSTEIMEEEEEEKRFKQLIHIILNDYKKYPNFSHFFNIKNLLPLTAS